MLKTDASRDERLQAICQLLHEQVAHYHWVGFYLADPLRRELHLGPFVGAPTEHTLIPYGRGICGQAAETLTTFVIQDVAAQDNYLACSLEVKSEIVVPVFKADQLVAELDIDSHHPSAFKNADEAFLLRVCDLVSAIF